jgi:hypothetical protein
MNWLGGEVVAGSRGWKISAAGAFFLVLAAARQEAVPLPDTLLPMPLEHALRVPFEAKPGDVVLRGRVVRTMAVKLEGTTSVSHSRFAQSFGVGDELTPVIMRAGRKGAADLIFCGSDQRARSKFMDVMIGDMGSKFESIVRFCFVDKDEDGRFEAFILGGAKDPAFQAPVAIPAVSYSMSSLVPHDDAEISVIYRKFSPKNQVMTFEIKYSEGGKNQDFDYIASVSLSDDKTGKHYPSFRTNPKKVPYPLHFKDIVGANIGVESVDPVSGAAQISINKDFSPTLVKPINIQVTYVFIYV